jgi:hypothetical protein
MVWKPKSSCGPEEIWHAFQAISKAPTVHNTIRYFSRVGFSPTYELVGLNEHT